jgi:hypothetical protein
LLVAVCSDHWRDSVIAYGRRINLLRPAEYKKQDVNRAKAFGFAAFHLDRVPDYRAFLPGIGEFGDVILNHGVGSRRPFADLDVGLRP